MNCLIPPKSFTVNNQNSRQLICFNAHWCTLKLTISVLVFSPWKCRYLFPIYKKIFKLKHLIDKGTLEYQFEMEKLSFIGNEKGNSQSQLLL